MKALRLYSNFQINWEMKFYHTLVFNLRTRNLASLLIGSLLINQYWLQKSKLNNSKSLQKKQRSRQEQPLNLKRSQLQELSGLRYLNLMSTVSLMKQACQRIITKIKSYLRLFATNWRRIKSNSSRCMRNGFRSRNLLKMKSIYKSLFDKIYLYFIKYKI